MKVVTIWFSVGVFTRILIWVVIVVIGVWGLGLESCFWVAVLIWAALFLLVLLIDLSWGRVPDQIIWIGAVEI